MAQITLNSTGVASNGTLALQSNGTTTAVTVDASQNVGVGVTPSAWGSTAKAVQLPYGCAIANLGAGDVVVTQNAYFDNPNFKYASTTGVGSSAYRQIDGTHRWSYAASGTAGNNITFSEAMRIDSSGNLLVAVTSTTVPGYGNTTTGVVINSNNPACFSLAKTDFVQVINQNTIDGSNYDLISFRTGGASRGNILSNGTTVSYNTSSDYRLKENVQPMTDALFTVAQLKPCTYTWKETGQHSQGFIAHELAEVVPDAVSGEKDAVNEDGSIKAQGIDTSFLVATLTAAIKELKALVDTQASTITQLQADVAALKGTA